MNKFVVELSGEIQEIRAHQGFFFSLYLFLTFFFIGFAEFYYIVRDPLSVPNS